MTNFKIFLFIFLNFIVIYARISDQRLCGNEDCSAPISLARTLLSYRSDDARILSFRVNENIKIVSKAAGTRPDLWGAEIKGRRGYVPVEHVRETKVFIAEPKFLISTEEAPKNSATILTKPVDTVQPNSVTKEVPVQDKIKPNSVGAPHDVIDGTTIYSNPGNENYSTPSTTPGNGSDAIVQQSKTDLPESKVAPIEPITPDQKIVLENINNQNSEQTENPTASKNSQETQKTSENLHQTSTENSQEIQNPTENFKETQSAPENIKTEATTNAPGFLDKVTKFFSKEEEDDAEIDDTEVDEDDEFDDEKQEEDEESQETSKENSVDAAINTEANLSKQSLKPADKSIEPVIPEADKGDFKSTEVVGNIAKAEDLDETENTKNSLEINGNSSENKMNKATENATGNTSEFMKSSKVDDNTAKVVNQTFVPGDVKSIETPENIKKSDPDTDNAGLPLKINKTPEATHNTVMTPEATNDTIKTPEVANDTIQKSEDTSENVKMSQVTNNTVLTLEATNETIKTPEDTIKIVESPEVALKSDEAPEVPPTKNESLENASEIEQSVNMNLSEVTKSTVVDKNIEPVEVENIHSLETPTDKTNSSLSDTVLVQNDTSVDKPNPSQLPDIPTDYNNNNNNYNFYPGVPSNFKNSINNVRKASEDVVNIEQSENTQVPENSFSPPDPHQNVNPTTESTISDVPPPYDSETTVTENPLGVNQDGTEFEQNSASIINTMDSNDLSQLIDNSSLNDPEDVKNDSVLHETVESETYLPKAPPIANAQQAEENISTTNEDKLTEVDSEQSLTESTDEIDSDEPGILSKIYSALFGSPSEPASVEDQKESNVVEEIHVSAADVKLEDTKHGHSYLPFWKHHAEENPAEKYLAASSDAFIADKGPIEMQSCDASQNPPGCSIQNENSVNDQQNADDSVLEFPENVASLFLYLSLTAVTVLLFSLGHYYIEKKRKDGTLIASINDLEKRLLISSKEFLLTQDDLKITKERLASIEDSSFGSNEMVTALKDEIEEFKNIRTELEEQNSNLEKELENATEAGMELNRMLREILSTQSGNEHLMQNIDHLQKQLNEQQLTINTMNTTLGVKNTENELLQTELSVANEKIVQLQTELNKMVVNVLSVQEEKTNSETDYEDQIQKLKTEFELTSKHINSELNVLRNDNKKLKSKVDETQRSLDLKTNEFQLLKEGMKDVQGVQSNKESLKALLDVSKVKAEVQQLRSEKHKISEKLQGEVEAKQVFEKEVQIMVQEVQILKDKFEEAERDKVEAQTRLEVLSSYFNDKEAQLQKEINENESKWMQKEGEATSTIERIKWIQEELQNYKSQNELLKKEILDQEVSLKSQISMLEKKSHDNWLLARQAERRVEESKQEASQLRNRLTIVEKNLNNSSQLADETKLQNRILLPLESNGELSVSPLHLSNVDNSGSPPLLYPHRDHMPTAPPIPGLPPPPFLPPPPGGFMPPPMPGVPPFMPPPPALFPGDHRPPPLGRMSSPPLHGIYSPDSRAYSPYDRDDSPPMSPTYPDSDYRRRSPPPPSHMTRNYSPYHSKGRPSQWDEDRDYRGPPPPHHRNKNRNHKGPGMSSGSGNSNESLENSGRHSGRV